MADRTDSDWPPRPRRFVVERYAPELTLEGMRAGEVRARRAAAAVTRSGHPVRYVGSIVIEAEETIFSVFEADAPESVAEVNRRACLPFDRVVPVVELREPERSVLAEPPLGPRPSRARVPRRTAFAARAASRKGSGPS